MYVIYQIYALKLKNSDNINLEVSALNGVSFSFGSISGNGITNTKGLTIGINTGFLVAIICWIYKFVTTGDPSSVPDLQPVY